MTSYFPGFGIEADEQFVRQGDAHDLGRFCGGAESLLEGDEVRFVAADHAPEHIGIRSAMAFRRFAEGMGLLEKSDALDAGMIACSLG